MQIAVTQGDFVGLIIQTLCTGGSCTFSAFLDTFGDTFLSLYGTAGGGALCAGGTQTLSCASYFLAKSTGVDTITFTCTHTGSSCQIPIFADHFISVGSATGAVYVIKCGNSPSACNNAASGGFNTVTNQGPIGVVWEPVSMQMTAGSLLSMSPFTGQTPISNMGIGGAVASASFWVTGTSNTPQFIISYTESGAVGTTTSDHAIIYLIGVPTGPAITACYGNCGNPPITLANTNSTHNIAFNSSVTLMYEFQSSQNGFLKNVTISFAKAYTNVNVEIGLYAAPNCAPGQPPFSSVSGCQGVFVSGSLTTVQSKGLFSSTAQPGQVLVFPGEWLAVAVSSSNGGMDFNDTNAVVTPFQVPGFMPGVIDNAFVATNLCGGCKMGLWAWITGTGINTPTVPPTSSGPCFGLDCILVLAVNGLCQHLTNNCQSGSAMFLVFILTFITIGVLLYMSSQLMPGVNITRGIGGMSILVFIGWLSIFGSLSLLNPWVLFLMFFSVAWLFVGRLKGTGPI